MKPVERLARLHCVNALLHEVTGHDLYLASQILDGIEAAAAGRSPGAGCEDLASHLAALHEQFLGRAPAAGFAFCDGAAEQAGGPLFVRAGLLAALRRNAPRARTTILVANLPGTAGPAPRRRQTRAARRQEREHADHVAQLRDLAARRANPRSEVTLLFV